LQFLRWYAVSVNDSSFADGWPSLRPWRATALLPIGAVRRQPHAFFGGASYYRALYRSVEEVAPLTKTPLPMSVMTITGSLGTGEYGEQLMKRLARDVTKSVVLQGAGHFVVEERSGQVAKKLDEFFSER
jgi:hypothetical protein